MTVTEKVRGYRLQERAGQDGPWSAYLATADRDGTSVLLRTLACRRVDKRRLKPLLRGFRFPDALAAHPNVIPVLDLGTTADGRPYLVTRLPGGYTLAERPGRSLPAPPGEALRIARAVANALAATHAAGGVHGDIRPENVVLPDHGEPALTGYGMSGLMSLAELPDGTSVSVHTPPELLEGRSASPASDVYSFGSMLYELLAGRPAFALDGPDTSARFVFGVLSEEPPPLTHRSLPPDLVTAVHQAMSKSPDARPTAAGLADLFAQTALPVAPVPPATAAPNGLPPEPGLGTLPSQAGSALPRPQAAPGLPPPQAAPGLSPALTGWDLRMLARSSRRARRKPDPCRAPLKVGQVPCRPDQDPCRAPRRPGRRRRRRWRCRWPLRRRCRVLSCGPSTPTARRRFPPRPGRSTRPPTSPSKVRRSRRHRRSHGAGARRSPCSSPAPPAWLY